MSQRTDFKIVYDGVGLRDHLMDVRDLAPALLSASQLIDRANFLMNGDRATIKLEVRALDSGSFEIWLEMSQSLYEQAAQFLTGDFVTSALNLKELIFGGGISLWVLYKFLKGKKPDKLEKLDPESIRITIDGQSQVFPLKLLRLYEDMAIRQAVEDMLQPLEKSGIDSFVVRSNDTEIASATKEERVYFSSYPEGYTDNLLSDREYEGVFAIISLAFKDDNKWRLSDGLATFNASIGDKNFLERVDARKEAFYKGDLLRCRIRTRQWDTDKGLKTEHEVIEVLEHIQSGTQLKLFDI